MRLGVVPKLIRTVDSNFGTSICHFAETINADQIILGCCGKGKINEKLKKIILGSTSKTVVEKATTVVVVVKKIIGEIPHNLKDAIKQQSTESLVSKEKNNDTYTTYEFEETGEEKQKQEQRPETHHVSETKKMQNYKTPDRSEMKPFFETKDSSTQPREEKRKISQEIPIRHEREKQTQDELRPFYETKDTSPREKKIFSRNSNRARRKN